MELDLEPLLEMAIVLDQEERLVHRREVEAQSIEKGIGKAGPSELNRRLRDLAIASGHGGRSQWTAPFIHAALDNRIARDDDHPEVLALVRRLAKQARTVAARAVRLGRRLRDLDMTIIGALRDMQMQGLDSRILRLVSDNPKMTATDIHERVEKDHREIAEAVASWKLSTGTSVVLSIRERSSIEEVEQSLRRLERTRRATRSGMPFSTKEWVVLGVGTKIRLAA